MKAEPIGKTIDAVLKDLKKGEKNKQRLICEILMQKVGEKESRHIQPCGFDRQVLTLLVDSPARMYVLNFKKSQLLRELQEELGIDTVKDIRLRIGKVVK